MSELRNGIYVTGGSGGTVISGGRFLSVWDCSTGYPETEPTTNPYEYKSGDYYIVGTVNTKTSANNYKPDGTTFNIGTHSTVVETETVKANDIYRFDGTSWTLIKIADRTVTFASIAGSPTDNTALNTELNKKANSSTTIGGYGITDAKITNNVVTLGNKNLNAVTSVNTKTPDSSGNVTIPVFTDISNKFTTSELRGTTLAFFRRLRAIIDPNPYSTWTGSGSAYMIDSAQFSDFPNSFKNSYDVATGQLQIYIPTRGMYIIEMSTTNNFTTKGSDDNVKNDSGKYMSIFDAYATDPDDGQLGKMVMLWNGFLVCPQAATPVTIDGISQYVYVPTAHYHSVSKYYLDNQLSSYSNTTQMNTAINNHHDGTKINEPSSDGTAGQVLVTNGQGGRSWGNAVTPIDASTIINLN